VNYIYKAQMGDYKHYPVSKKHYTSEYEMADIVRQHPSYRQLPAHTAQQTIKFMLKSWKSFWRSLKAWKIHPENFKHKPEPPRMLPKDGFYTLHFTNNQCKIRDGYLVFPRLIGLRVATRIQGKVRHVRIVPIVNKFIVEIMYERSVPSLRSPKNIIAVDLGLDNIITAVSNVSTPLIIKGTPLKSYNQWYNKVSAHLQSMYSLQQPDARRVVWGKKQSHLRERRYFKIENALHQISAKFIQYCLSHNIDTIVIGYNEGWKHNVNLGSKNNQNFVGIPYLNLIRKIEYKAEDNGIRVIRHEENYTSKCSFWDDEQICKHKMYKGRRVHRGLFKSEGGILLNADCNGAGNIGRKVFPKTFVKGIVDTVSYPTILTIQKQF